MPAIASLNDLKAAQKPLRYALCATCLLAGPKQSKVRRRMLFGPYSLHLAPHGI
jgi:hypothetical protein